MLPAVLKKREEKENGKVHSEENRVHDCNTLDYSDSHVLFDVYHAG